MSAITQLTSKKTKVLDQPCFILSSSSVISIYSPLFEQYSQRNLNKSLNCWCRKSKKWRQSLFHALENKNKIVLRVSIGIFWPELFLPLSVLHNWKFTNANDSFILEDFTKIFVYLSVYQSILWSTVLFLIAFDAVEAFQGWSSHGVSRGLLALVTHTPWNQLCSTSKTKILLGSIIWFTNCIGKFSVIYSVCCHMLIVRIPLNLSCRI